MPRPLHSARCVALVGCLLLPAAAAAADRAAELLEASLRATGGAAAEAVRTVHLRGRITMTGLAGAIDTWEDRRTGRYRDLYALGPLSGSDGFDGVTLWTRNAQGRVAVLTSDEDRAAGLADAYRRSESWWFRRRPGAVTYVGARAEGGARYEVIRAEPEAGHPFELWLDARTLLVARVVETIAGDVVTTALSDYRPVHGVQVAFRSRQAGPGDSAATEIALDEVQLDAEPPPGVFGLPLADSGIDGGQAEAAVPLRDVDGHLYLELRLDGRGPFLFLCGSGSANALSPEAARALGAADGGSAYVTRVQLGAAWLADQAFDVVTLTALREADGVPVEGLIGAALLSRFVVRVDHARGQLTLRDPAAPPAPAPAGAVSLPLTFTAGQPIVDGAIDGVPARLQLDVGSRGTVDLTAAFVQAHGLQARYRARFEDVAGFTLAGPVRRGVARAGAVALGPVQLRDVPVHLAAPRSSIGGAPPDAFVGSGVLRQFAVTFDRSRRVVVLEPNAALGQPMAYDRAGLWINAGPGHFKVIDVTPGGPAERAGLRRDDRILAVDGAPAAGLAVHEVRARLRTGKPGTAVRLRVERAGEAREVVVTLRDLLADG